MKPVPTFQIERQNNIIEVDLYADKSSLVIEWLLLKGSRRECFAIREVERELNFKIRPARIHKMFEFMVHRGFLKSVGYSTKKRFQLFNAPGLLRGWLDSYSIMRKCPMWYYSCPIPEWRLIEERIARSSLKDHVALALHSAARANGYANSNLNTVEFYIENIRMIPVIEHLLDLKHQERSYRVLLISPFYKAAHHFGGLRSEITQDRLRASRPLFNLVDLYSFPLRASRGNHRKNSGDIQNIRGN
jgi:hypothetical protein